jgi:ElaB/YqjD/DUF883 family membrane-anchored ribosome-binding protein
MAESLHSSSDIPKFDSHPSTPPHGEPLIYRRSERSALEQRAADLGAAAGRIASIMKQTRNNLEGLAHHSIYERLVDLAENAVHRSEQLRRVAAAKMQGFTHVAQDKATVLGRQTREKTAELGRQARSNYHRARLKASQTVRDYPVETAVAAGVAGFLIGVGLRIRRAKRAY